MAAPEAACTYPSSSVECPPQCSQRTSRQPSGSSSNEVTPEAYASRAAASSDRGGIATDVRIPPGTETDKARRRPPRCGYPAQRMRLCLVTPYAWDRPSEANDHWSALARALAHRGHEVVILAPARKPALLMEGRRRLRALARGDASALTPSPNVPLVVAVGLGVPVSTGAAARSVPIPVAVAAGVRLALVRGGFDAVDVLDPDQPGPSAVALRETPTPVVATFFGGGPSL